MEDVHLEDVLFGGRDVAEPPAVHGVGLGHAVEGEGPLLHAGKGRDADMLAAVIDEPLVDLVGDDQKIVADGDPGQLLKDRAGKDSAGGIVGSHDDDCLGLIGDLGLDLFDVQLIVVFFFKLVLDGLCSEKIGYVQVVEPHGIRDQDLVVRIEYGHQDRKDRLRKAGCDQDLCGLVGDVVLS